MLSRTCINIATILVLTLLSSISAAEEESYKGVSLSVGGYGSMRFEASSSDEVPEAFTFRRFIVTTDAKIEQKVKIFSEVEYERLSEIEIERAVKRGEGGVAFEQEVEGTSGSELALEQAWGQFDFSQYVGLRFGAVLPPLGRFNIRHDDDLWDLPRRSLTDRGLPVLPVAAAWTEMGAGLVGSAFVGDRGKIDYTLYALNGVTLDFTLEEKVQAREPKRDKLELEAEITPTQGAFDGSKRATAMAGRLALSPVLGSEYAISGYIGAYTPDYLNIKKKITAFGIDGVQKAGHLRLEGEFLYMKFDGLSDVLADFAKVVVNKSAETESAETANLETEIEFDLKGLSDKRYGFWIDLKAPLSVKGTPLEFGLSDPQLIPIVRYERVWLKGSVDEFEFADGAVTTLASSDRGQQRVTVGLSYRPTPTVSLQTAYERSDATDGDQLIVPTVSDKSTNSLLVGMAFGF
jgi:hypothetical protein